MCAVNTHLGKRDPDFNSIRKFPNRSARNASFFRRPTNSRTNSPTRPSANGAVGIEQTDRRKSIENPASQQKEFPTMNRPAHRARSAHAFLHSSQRRQSAKKSQPIKIFY